MKAFYLNKTVYALRYYHLTSSINNQKLVLAFGILGGVKKAKFAVCLIFRFELHAMWLDWCQIGSLSGDSFGDSFGA